MAHFSGYTPTRLDPFANQQDHRARDGADVWADHGEVLQAQEEKTSRLKALRLAKAAAEAAVAAAMEFKPKRKPVSV
jgi:hypothetical protein